MIKEKKRNREQLLSCTYSSKQQKENKSQARKTSTPLRHKHSLSDPFKTLPSTTIQKIFDFPISPNCLHKKTPLSTSTHINANPGQEAERNTIDNCISDKVTQIVEKKLIPFFTTHLDTLEKNFNSELNSMRSKIEEQNKEIQSLKKKLRQKEHKQTKNTGTSPIKNPQDLTETEAQGLEKLNHLLGLFETNFQEESNRTSQKLCRMETKVEYLSNISEEYISKLSNITETFNDNFLELDGRIQQIQKRITHRVKSTRNSLC